MSPAVWIAIAVVVVLVIALALYLWVTRQALIALKQRVDEAWADITAQEHQRAELVPPLLDAVRGYADHERPVYDAVERARGETLAAGSPSAASTAENHMQRALHGLFGVAESFPKLQSSQQFLGLQSQLVETEDRIQSSRRFYNGGVREFNTKIQVFPNHLFAQRLGFSPREFFEVADAPATHAPPRIQF